MPHNRQEQRDDPRYNGGPGGNGAPAQTTTQNPNAPTSHNVPDDTADDSTPPSLSNQQQITQEFASSPLDWAAWVSANVGESVINYYNANNMDPQSGMLTYGQYVEPMMSYLETTFLQAADNRYNLIPGFIRDSLEGSDPRLANGLGRSYYTTTEKGKSELLNAAFGWIGQRMGFNATDFAKAPRSPGSPGTKKPTAAEIRERFDLDQLEEMAQQLYRGTNLDEWKNARSVARSYVDAVVKTGGTQAIDYETFVRKRIEGTGRYKSIYKNKPSYQTAQEYIAPYLSVARSTARPGDADEIAIQGAQFGASADDFAGRLQREEASQGTSGFIQNLEGRMRNLNSLFKG